MTYNFNPLATLTNMPNMSTTLNGWEAPLSLIRIKQTTNDGDVETTEEYINFQGVWQPLKMEILMSKPEGQRSWNWFWIHAKAGTLNLNTADKVIFQDRRYKIMNKKDYSLNGFVEYEAILDFQE